MSRAFVGLSGVHSRALSLVYSGHAWLRSFAQMNVGEKVTRATLVIRQPRPD